MIKKFVLFISILLIFASQLFSETITRKAVYKKPDINEPARIEASEIDASRTTIKVEKVSGKFSSIYIYAVNKNGETFKFKTYSAGWEIPMYKWLNYSNIDDFKEFIFYVNADKGGESLYEAEVNLVFETTEIMKEPVFKEIGVNDQGIVEPVYFPLKEISGANYVTLNMESGNQGNIVIFAYNPKTKDKKIIKTVSSQWNNTYLERAIDDINRDKYTQLGIKLEKPDESFSFENANGTVTVKVLSNEELKKRDAIVEEFNSFKWRLLLINLIAGLLFMKLFYPLFSRKIMRFRVIALISPALVLIIWAGIVYLISLTPVIPHHIYYGRIAWMFGSIPLLITVGIPITVDAKYNKCKKCGYYGKMEFLDYDQSETTTQFSARDGNRVYDAGHETDTTFTDYRGCPNCGNVISGSTTITTGTGRKSLYKQNGKVYEKDNGGILGSILITFLNPYTWYLIFKKITILK